MRALAPSVRDRPLRWFFALAYAVSWALWFPAAAASVGWVGPVPSYHLHLAGGLGPMLAAMIVTWLAEGQPALARLAKRCVRGDVWIIIAILIPAGLFLIATAIIAVFAGAAIDWSGIGRSTEFPFPGRSTGRRTSSSTASVRGSGGVGSRCRVFSPTPPLCAPR
jgi:hypothetical protein